MRSRSLLLVLTSLVTACAPALVQRSGEPAHMERLYFGRNIGDTAVVSDSAWRQFLHEVVTPRFPDGLTSWDANGVWRTGEGVVVRERTFVLEMLHVADAEVESRVRSVIEAYKARFAQQSVLRVVTDVRASF